jgi:hypothetical protein
LFRRASGPVDHPRDEKQVEHEHPGRNSEPSRSVFSWKLIRGWSTLSRNRNCGCPTFGVVKVGRRGRRDVFSANLSALRVSALAFSLFSETANGKLPTRRRHRALAQIYFNVLNVGLVGAIQTTFCRIRQSPKLSAVGAADPSPTRKRWDFCPEPRERHGCGTRGLRKVPATTLANVVKLIGLLVELVIELPFSL